MRALGIEVAIITGASSGSDQVERLFDATFGGWSRLDVMANNRPPMSGSVSSKRHSRIVDPAKLNYATPRMLMPRFGRPADVAIAALCLASDRSIFITE